MSHQGSTRRQPVQRGLGRQEQPRFRQRTAGEPVTFPRDRIVIPTVEDSCPATAESVPPELAKRLVQLPSQFRDDWKLPPVVR